MTESHELTLPEEIASAEHLPTIPGVAVEVLRLTEDEDSSIQDLATALEKDPALAGKILKLSNSGLFGVGSEVTTLDRATMVLGLKTVKLMSLSFSLVAALPREGTGDFDYEAYWERSIITAVASRAFANRACPVAADQAFLIGLLAQLGQLAIQEALPGRYADVLAKAKDAWPTAELEREVLGYSSPEVGAGLLRSWSIPDAIWGPVLAHQDPDGAPPADEQAKVLVQVVHCAWLAADLLVGSHKGTALETLMERTERYFQWAPEESEAVLVDLQEPVQETARILEFEIRDPSPVPELLRKAQEQLVRVSLGVATEMHAARNQVRDLEDKATTDALTRLANRAAFDEMMDECAKERMNEPLEAGLGLLMIDIDHFKALNDTYGHQGGDDVLKQVSSVMKSVMRPTDTPARYGGEEFAVVMPQATSAGLRALAERIRSAIEEKEFDVGGKSVAVTVSIGGALTNFVKATSDVERLIGVADRYLYEAKRSGRNRCKFFPGNDVTEGS